jgi:hypothetical protein
LHGGGIVVNIMQIHWAPLMMVVTHFSDSVVARIYTLNTFCC